MRIDDGILIQIILKSHTHYSVNNWIQMWVNKWLFKTHDQYFFLAYRPLKVLNCYIHLFTHFLDIIDQTKMDKKEKLWLSLLILTHENKKNKGWLEG